MSHPTTRIARTVLLLSLLAAAPLSPAGAQSLPILTSPADGATTGSLTPALAWQPFPGADLYQLQLTPLSSAYGSTQRLLHVSLAGTAYTVEADLLQPETTYYWHVRARTPEGVTGWSAEYRFTTPAEMAPGLPAPVPTNPPDGAVDQPTALSLAWGSVEGAAAYTVELSGSPDFTPLVQAWPGVTATSRSIAGLSPGTTYHWRVRAEDAGGTAGPWATAVFTTAAGSPPPSVPVPTSPADGATTGSLTPALAWQPFPGADLYQLQLTPLSSAYGSTQRLLHVSLAGTTYAVEAGLLQPETTYYWHVRARTPEGVTGWSAEHHFTTPGDDPPDDDPPDDDPPTPPAPGPVLLIPEADALWVLPTPTLAWTIQDDAFSYEVQVAADAGFTDLLHWLTVSTPSHALSAPLERGRTYYWRVSAHGTAGSTGWSTGRAFTTLPDPPSPTTPVPGAVGQPPNPSLGWTPVSGATGYEVRLSASPDLFAAATHTTGSTALAWPAETPLAPSTTYYWQAAAVRDDGVRRTSGWSPTASFTTAADTPPPPPPPTALTLLSPGPMATGVGILPTYAWTAVADVLYYALEVAYDVGFTLPALLPTFVTTTQYAQPSEYPLVPGFSYYWRVTAYQTSGAQLTSDVGQFTVADAGTLVLSSPLDGAAGVSLTPTFVWNPLAGASDYQLEVGLEPGFSTHAVWVTVPGTSYTTPAALPLQPGLTYYWRVTTLVGSEPAFSATWRFTTETLGTELPAAPFLLAPSDGTLGVPLDVALSWQAVDGASSYALQTAAEPAFTAPILNMEGFAGTTYQPSGLQHAQTYYWRVRAENAGGAGPWSAAARFTTASPPSPPSTPQLLEPEPGAVVGTDVTLWWSAPADAVGYDLQVSIYPDFWAFVVDVAGLLETSYGVQDLSALTTYYWRVRTRNAHGTSAWTTAASFTTSQPPQPPAPPALTAPAADAAGVVLPVRLQWQPSAGAQTYRLQIADNTAFLPTAVDQGGLTQSFLDVSTLDPATTYHWRVLAFNENGNAESEVRRFTTRAEPETPPGAPALVSPISEAVDVPTRPTLSWQAVPDAVTYDVQIGLDAGFVGLVHHETGWPDEAWIPATALAEGTRHHWRVRACGAPGCGPWSASRAFTTETTAPGPISVLAPASGATWTTGTTQAIRWSDPAGDAVQIDLFQSDILDRPIATAPAATTQADWPVPADLEARSDYRIRIRSLADAARETFSGTFTVVPPAAAPPPPTLVSPEDGASLTALPTLRWQHAAGADRYRIQIDDAEAFPAPAVLETTDDHLTPTQVFAPGTSYFWRVQSENDVGPGDWSEPRRFSVAAEAGDLRRYYYLKDHLGSIRATVDEAGDVVHYDDYFPFGLRMPHRSMDESAPRERFTGHELDDATALLYAGARYYDPELGRWLSIDPMAGSYASYSPYVYGFSNPLRYYDPTGLAGRDTVGIDPGHGDQHDSNNQVDPGAVNGPYHEKDFTLLISQAILELLELYGVDALSTRQSDVTDAGKRLQWRLDAASGASILVSIHINAAENKDARGFGVYYQEGNDRSEDLASAILAKNTLFRNRGLRDGSSLYLLKNFVGDAAVLVESGFITNDEDLNILINNSRQVGTQIGFGILDYLGVKRRQPPAR